MEIVNANSMVLSNFEVLKHLQKVKDSKMKGSGSAQLATITYETIRYLEDTPCKNQTPENIRKCLEELTPFNLSKTEMLMMINSPPTSALEIQLMVEESVERLSEVQVASILEIILKYFPHVAKENPEEDDEKSE